MKQLIQYSVLSLIIHMFCHAGFVCGANENATLSDTSAGSAGTELVGTVVEAVPRYSPENLDKLATVEAWDQFNRILIEISSNRPAANVLVTAKGMSATKKTKTDSEGKFRFVDLPSGHYEISAEMPSRFFWTGEKRPAVAKIPVELDRSNWVRLELRTDLVTVKGRVIDSNGHPVVGAKVRGIPCADLNRERQMIYPFRYALSSDDGSYELRDVVPPKIMPLSGYLITGNTYNNTGPSHLLVYVEANGYLYDEQNATRIPLVTEELLGPARRFLKILHDLDVSINGDSVRVEKKDKSLPASTGNTITGVDIVLKKAGKAEQ